MKKILSLFGLLGLLHCQTKEIKEDGVPEFSKELTHKIQELSEDQFFNLRRFVQMKGKLEPQDISVLGVPKTSGTKKSLKQVLLIQNKRSPLFHLWVKRFFSLDGIPRTPNVNQQIAMLYIPKEADVEVNFHCCIPTPIASLENEFKTGADWAYSLNGTFFNIKTIFKNHEVNQPLGEYKAKFEYKPLKNPKLRKVFTNPTFRALRELKNKDESRKMIILTNFHRLLDESGILLIDGKRREIVDYQEFLKQKDSLSDQAQYLFGNKLVEDGVVQIEEKDFRQGRCLKDGRLGELEISAGDTVLSKIKDFSGKEPTVEIRRNTDPSWHAVDKAEMFGLCLFVYNFSPFKYMGFTAPGLVPSGIPSHGSDINPRTAIMTDKNGDMAFFIVLGRGSTRHGYDLLSLAHVMNAFGAEHALNLDGGASSYLAWATKENPKGLSINPQNSFYHKVENLSGREFGNLITVSGRDSVEK